MLDFVNTAGGRTKARDTERLVRYADVVDWGRHARMLTAPEAGALRSAAAADPAAADRAVADLRVQREAVHAFLLAAVNGTACAAPHRDRVHADIIAAHRHAQLSEGFPTGTAWVVAITHAGLAAIARRLALDTAALVAGEQRHQIRVCGRCSWFFLDPSPARRRRWCSMATCGNRAKAQRHHQSVSVPGVWSR